MMVPFSCLILLLFSEQFVDGFRINRLQALHTRWNMAVTSKSTTAESARFNVLTEIERQQQQTTPRYGLFNEHRQRLKEMGLTNAAATGGLSKRKEKMAMFHISSSFDDVKASDNTNINDKFWRAALKLGTLPLSSTIPLPLSLPHSPSPFLPLSSSGTVVKGLEGFPVVPEKFGPFTEPGLCDLLTMSIYDVILVVFLTLPRHHAYNYLSQQQHQHQVAIGSV